MYCSNDEEGNYENFFESKMQVRMCGIRKDKILKVKMEEVNNGTGSHYGYKDLESGEIEFIFKTKRKVEMCSTDGFKSEIKAGEGKIVNLNIKEIE